MPVPYRAVAERRVVERLLLANAVWPGSGQPLDGLRWIERRAVKRLVAAGVIREEGAGRYYLHAPAYAGRLASRRRRLVIALLIVMAAAAVVGSGALAGLFPR